MNEQDATRFEHGETAASIVYLAAVAEQRGCTCEAYVDRYGIEEAQDVAYLGAIPMLQEVSADVFNRMFPLGKNRFDLRDATTASTNILVHIPAMVGPGNASPERREGYAIDRMGRKGNQRSRRRCDHQDVPSKVIRLLPPPSQTQGGKLTWQGKRTKRVT